MKIGIGFSCNDDSFLAGQLAIEQAVSVTGEPTLTFLFCTSNYNQEIVYESVRKAIGNSRLIGGSTFGVITAKGVFEKGVGVCTIGKGEIEAETMVINSKSLPECNLLENKLREFNFDTGTLFIFPDCSCDKIPLVLRRMYDIMGPDFTYIGAGTADNLYFTSGHQYTEKGVVTQSIAVALLKGLKIKVGIGHGCEPWGEPMMVTKSSGKILYEIDGFPAFDVYSNNLGLKSKTDFSFFGMKYPFGMPCAGTNFLIRGPISVNEDGSIILTSEMPQNNVISLMRGNPKRFITTTEEVIKHATLNKSKPKAIFLFNCVSRYLLMKNDFEKELNIILNIVGKDTPVIGMLTFGGISAYSSVPLFHNKTILIAAGW